jgi:hypothetical protein
MGAFVGDGGIEIVSCATLVLSSLVCVASMCSTYPSCTIPCIIAEIEMLVDLPCQHGPDPQ